ncbi:MAG: ABC transporter ATP-binding protein [Thermoplasmata archaeon]|nr:MAG: ABC transporter ATP-binding protein [Thermoplasmata archaeon]
MLEVLGVSKTYGDFVALSEVSFAVRPGEVLGLVGENGAGKSTTLKIIAGLIEPDSGEVRLFGEKLRDDMKKMIGYLPEIDALYENMTTSEYLQFFADLYDVRVDTNKLLRRFDIPEKPISELSKGMKRKLSIARTLIHDPKVLVYDEPTGGLDPGTSLLIAKIMCELAAEGRIVVFSAHNMYYVEEVADTVLILKQGRPLYYGDLEELIGSGTRYRVEYVLDGVRQIVEVGSAPELGKVVAEVVGEGGRIVEVDKEVPRLESVYFKLMSRNFKNEGKIYQ